MKSSKKISGYARAIYELAVEQKAQESVYKELQSAAGSLSDELLSFVANPSFNAAEIRSVIDEFSKKLELSDEVRALIILMAQAGKLAGLTNLLESYRDLYFRDQGRTLVTIRSPWALNKEQRQSVEKVFSTLVEGTIETEEEIDPSLIGGVVVQIGSKVFDGSLRGRLERMRQRLLGNRRQHI